ncbi:MAG: cytochrome c [Deltaproteobacteria bacterium]|nr:cytochrome c [Deltaproteobacteria bacterium]
MNQTISRAPGKARAAAALLFTALFLLSAAPAEAQKGPAGAAQIYEASCAICHGPTGKGDGPAAAKMPVKVGDLADCTAMAKVVDTRLFRVIKEGAAAATKGSPLMVAWGQKYSDAEIRSLVGYIRGFCRGKR